MRLLSPTRRFDGLPPGKPLFDAVRGLFVGSGTTLNAWCRDNGIARQSATMALVGIWDGVRAMQLRQKIIKAARAARHA